MKKAWVIIIVAVLGAAFIGGCIAVNNFFPKADTISCPDAEEILSASVTRNKDLSSSVTVTDTHTLLQNISIAQPTRRMGVNDYPASEIYYTVRIDTSEREYWYFVYEENSCVYIEVPYEGIYKTDKNMFSFILNHF